MCVGRGDCVRVCVEGGLCESVCVGGSHAEGKDRLLYNYSYNYASTYNNNYIDIIIYAQQLEGTHAYMHLDIHHKLYLNFSGHCMLASVCNGICTLYNLVSFDVWQNIHSWLWYTYQTAGVCTYMYVRLALPLFVSP